MIWVALGDKEGGRGVLLAGLAAGGRGGNSEKTPDSFITVLGCDEIFRRRVAYVRNVLLEETLHGLM